MKKKLTLKEKRKRFAPLRAWEDYQHAVWFLLGAITLLISIIAMKILFG